ncbi:polymorphic toxin-type HINT domain-containing protein, partial [Actinomadura rugatobispora]
RLWGAVSDIAGGIKDWFKANRALKAAEKAANTARAAADAAPKLCKKNSFLPDTRVRLPDGRTKPIKKIKAGDKVLATDIRTGKTSHRTVVATVAGADIKNLVQVNIDSDGDRGVKADVIIATGNHPFWVQSLSRWLPAEQVRAGMWLRSDTGTQVRVTAIRTWSQYQHVHNLTVAIDHTYYVEVGATTNFGLVSMINAMTDLPGAFARAQSSGDGVLHFYERDGHLTVQRHADRVRVTCSYVDGVMDVSDKELAIALLDFVHKGTTSLIEDYPDLLKNPSFLGLAYKN